MKIVNHRFVDYWFGRSKDVGDAIPPPKFIVMHYTAGGDAAASRDYMMLSPTQKQRRLGARKPVYASAHLVVSRKGEVWQIVPFNYKARHAGVSSWKGMNSLNQYSIGIEIANYGWLDRQPNGKYSRPGQTPEFSEDQVVIDRMPGSSRELKGWEMYPQAQIEQVEQLTQALLDYYPSIVDILRHQDISPNRKFDPGPAFPMERIRALLHERRSRGDDTDTDTPAHFYVTTTTLNIRGGAGIGFEKMTFSPLAPGTRLVVINEHDDWSFVRLVDSPENTGWVYNKYLALA